MIVSSLISHRFQPFICCLSVVLWLDKGDFPGNLHTVCVRVKINKRSFELLCVCVCVGGGGGGGGSCTRAVILFQIIFFFMEIFWPI